jgi:hypothetical protein
MCRVQTAKSVTFGYAQKSFDEGMPGSGVQIQAVMRFNFLTAKRSGKK